MLETSKHLSLMLLKRRTRIQQTSNSSQIMKMTKMLCLCSSECTNKSLLDNFRVPNIHTCTLWSHSIDMLSIQIDTESIELVICWKFNTIKLSFFANVSILPKIDPWKLSTRKSTNSKMAQNDHKLVSITFSDNFAKNHSVKIGLKEIEKL